MKTRRLTLLLVGLLCALALAGGALAMSSEHYRLDWSTLLAGSGGGAASSTNYAVNFTVGQAVVGPSSSSNYGACLGYWCSGTEVLEVLYEIYLPVVLRSSL